MGAETIMGITVGVLCGFLAVLHAVLWRFSPTDRLQLWTAIALLGYALLNFSMAGSAGPSAGALGWTVPWIALSVPSLVAPPAMIAVMSGIAGRPVRGARRVFLLLVIAGMLVLTIDGTWFLITHARDPLPRWEAFAAGTGALGTILPVSMIVMFGTALFDGVRALRRGDRQRGWLLVAPSVIAFPLAFVLGAGSSSGPAGPRFPGLLAVPLLLVASWAMTSRYAKLIKIAPVSSGYRLLRRLGGGGMGELFLAVRDGAGGFERLVAMKRVLSTAVDPDSLDGLLAEARIAAKLVHPNIVSVYDVGRLEPEPGQTAFGWFIAMEYLPGINLARVRDAARERDTPLPVAFVAAVGREVCRGLAHAHTAAIVHRDISPHNVMVTFSGAVKIVDFGIAAVAGAAEPGVIRGKISYLSPEQARSQAIGPPSDLFSLGIVLYELLTGERPFVGAGTAEIVSRILAGHYRPIDQMRPGLPPRLSLAIARALSADLSVRYESAQAMAADLAAVVAAEPALDVGELVSALCARDLAEQTITFDEATRSIGVDQGTTVVAPVSRPLSG